MAVPKRSISMCPSHAMHSCTGRPNHQAFCKRPRRRSAPAARPAVRSPASPRWPRVRFRVGLTSHLVNPEQLAQLPFCRRACPCCACSLHDCLLQRGKKPGRHACRAMGCKRCAGSHAHLPLVFRPHRAGQALRRTSTSAKPTAALAAAPGAAASASAGRFLRERWSKYASALGVHGMDSKTTSSYSSRRSWTQQRLCSASLRRVLPGHRSRSLHSRPVHPEERAGQNHSRQARHQHA